MHNEDGIWQDKSERVDEKKKNGLKESDISLLKVVGHLHPTRTILMDFPANQDIDDEHTSTL